MNNNFDDEFGKAIKILVQAMPSAEDLVKPTLLHSLRVGLYLYNHEYSRNICLGALLHDTLEDTALTEETLQKDFGPEVSQLVLANTKDKSITDKTEQVENLIEKCVASGEEALIIKAADILDNFEYSRKIQRQEWIEKMKFMTQVLLERKPESFKDPIFELLKKTVNE